MTDNISPLILIRVAGLPSSSLQPMRGDFVPLLQQVRTTAQHLQQQRKEVLSALTSALDTLPASPQRTAVYNLRKRMFHQAAYLPPIHWHQGWQDPVAQPIHEALHALRQAQATCQAAQAAFSAYYRSVWAQSLMALQTLAQEEYLVGRSLLFSSHALLQALPDFAHPHADLFSGKNRATAFSLMSYVSRAVYKTVPLSAWASVGVWRPLSDHSDFSPFGKSVATPNVELLPLLYEVLLREPVFYQSLHLRLTPSFSEGQQWVQVEGQGMYFFQSQQEVVGRMAEWLKDKSYALPYLELQARVAEATGLPADEVAAFLQSCVDKGFLEWVLPEYGLSAGWCGHLYQYLGYLPASPLLTEAAFLLQWLRTAARSLPFQGLEEARAAQCDAHAQVQQFFARHLPNVLSIGPEQVFYLDVEKPVAMRLPVSALTQAVHDLRTCWLAQSAQHLIPLHAQVVAYAREVLVPGAAMGVLEFGRGFLEAREADMLPVAPEHLPILPFRGKIGATVCFFLQNGVYRAVVNGLFPGGGKLFARWAHVLPPDFQAAWAEWLDVPVFPPLGWSNVNFQPAYPAAALALPTERRQQGSSLRWPDVEVMLNEDLLPQVFERHTGKALLCTDLSLESADVHPLLWQVLWHLMVPAVSAEGLLGAFEAPYPKLAKWGWQWERLEWGCLVVSRAMWGVEERVWRGWLTSAPEEEVFFQNMLTVVEQMGWPGYVWVSWVGQRHNSRGVDWSNPLQVALFYKMLRQGGGMLLVTEMLPLPEHSGDVEGGGSAAEFVLEFSAI